MFEGIAKTNTTNTYSPSPKDNLVFEGIAKTNTTNTYLIILKISVGLRVLLKQIQQTHSPCRRTCSYV